MAHLWATINRMAAGKPHNSFINRRRIVLCLRHRTPQTAGYYSVSVNTTLVASAAGPVTVTLYQDGQAVSGATQTVTAAAADSVGIAFTAPVRVYRGQVSSRLQVIVTGQAVTTSNVAVEVVKE